MTLRPTALWASSLHWNSASHVSAHHYARLLAERGWDVAFISYPVTPLHLLKLGSEEVAIRFRSWWQRGERDLDGRLFSYTPLSLFPPLKAPCASEMWSFDNWHRFTSPNLVRLAHEQGFGHVDLLVVDSYMQSFWLDEIKAGCSLLRITDNIAGMPWATPAVVKRETELIGRVDCVAYTARQMEGRILAAHPRATIYTPNGAEIDHFLQGPGDLPAEYAHIPSPRAVFVGAIADWFDTHLLAESARRLPQVSFVLVGPEMTDMRPLEGLSNVYRLGRRAYQAIPAYMKNAQVGLIPFRDDELVRSVNPIKLFEYLACGLPVVSTDWEELRRLDTPATLCGSVDEFVAAIERNISTPADPTGLVNFARKVDWRERFELLVNALQLEQIESGRNADPGDFAAECDNPSLVQHRGRWAA